MSRTLCDRTSELAVLSTQAIRDKIHEEWGAATSVEQRDALLAMLHSTLNIAEVWIAKNGDAKELADFKERRADEYARLLVNESCDADGNVSAEVLMSVTNRELAAGRMKSDDPIRRAAVENAARPYLAHAQAFDDSDSTQKSEAQIQDLVADLKSKPYDVVESRERIQKVFDGASTHEQRGRVLAIFKAVSDNTIRNIASKGPELLDEFQKTVAQEYKIFIVKECTVGLDTPVVGGDVSVDQLMAVTNREVAAGRMTEDHSLRQIAVKGAAEPHSSHRELVAHHAQLKQQAGSEANNPGAVPTTATRGETNRQGLGQKLKSFFRK
jgi:hypothetical protein